MFGKKRFPGTVEKTLKKTSSRCSFLVHTLEVTSSPIKERLTYSIVTKWKSRPSGMKKIIVDWFHVNSKAFVL